MGLKANRSLVINGRKIQVYDDIFSQSEVNNFALTVSSLSFRRRKSFDNELSVPIVNEKFCQAPFLFPVTQELFEDAGRSEFGVEDSSVALSHVYAAAINTTSSGTVHQDINSPQAITFLYYANSVWRGRWGGETVFYDRDLDATYALTPKPGRLVMFHSDIFHRAGIPHPDTPCFRYTVSVFYYPEQNTSTTA